MLRDPWSPMHSESGSFVPPTMRGLLALAWPIIVQRAAQVVVGFTDAIMVADLGEAALAATTAGSTNSFLAFILPMGMVFVVASFSSQFKGKGDLAGARRYGWYGLIVALAAAIFSIASTLVVPNVVDVFGYAPDVARDMTTYLEIRLLGAGFVVGLEALGSYYGGLSNTRLPMVAQVIAMVLNVALNYALIGGHFGAPALGVAGAAWASVIATVVGFLFLFACFIVQFGHDRVEKRAYFEMRELLRLVRFGFPSGLNWFFEFAAFAFFINVVVTALGTTALAALMAVLQLNSMSFMPAFGLSSAGAVFVGQAIGAGRRDDVPGILKLALIATCSWQGLVGISYLVVPSLLLRPFEVEALAKTEFIAVAVWMLRISAAWQLFDAVVNAISETLRAAGDTAFTLWARLAIAWTLFVPGAWIAVRTLEGGVTAAMIALLAYLGVLALVLWLRFRNGAWRRIELTEPVVI
jgi:MATE family multidrug resistance protein